MSTIPLQLPLLEEAVAAARAHTDRVPEVALVLGSGLGGFADTLEDSVVVPYGELPRMPVSAVAGHAGNLVFGKAEGVEVVAMQGRVHLYEGHSPQEIVFGLRLMLRLGAKTVIITNAAGGCGEGMEPGDLMIIEDHLNLTGQNCLVGPNEEAFGVRFPDMSIAYDPSLGALADEVAKGQGFSLRRGVYAGFLGPAYETPAEVRMARTLGADAVGMSTVLEVIAARHMGARVLGISCITNKAAGISETPLSHDEVKEIATIARPRFVGLLRGVLSGIAAGSSGEAQK
jgi:purine-nucleoside phosphorylase